MACLRIGTSSWKYDSWEGLVYSPGSAEGYLVQYAREFDTVEIDQWFWSLFDSPVPRLPEPTTAAEYAAAVPEGFRFTIKVPNSITLTHHYDKGSPTFGRTPMEPLRGKGRKQPLRPNPHFLSRELFAAFLGRTEALHSRIGALIFQFEYLNRRKMPSQEEFQSRFGEFASGVACPLPCAVEIRNPNYLNEGYFGFLETCGYAPCLLQGYYMPDLRQVFGAHEEQLLRRRWLILRLHGPDRKGMEALSGGRWDRVVAPKDEEIDELGGIISRALARGLDIYLNVNNHYEGSAPLTIAKIRAAIQKRATAEAQSSQ
jgi:uncharacterized protein YecE (DUF72 family)